MTGRSVELLRLADAVLQPGFEGTTAPDWLRRRLAGGLGGVALFSRNIVNRDQLRRVGEPRDDQRPGVRQGGDDSVVPPEAVARAAGFYLQPLSLPTRQRKDEPRIFTGFQFKLPQLHRSSVEPRFECRFHFLFVRR